MAGAAQGSSVLVRFWAGARAAAGTPEVVVDVSGPLSVADLRSRLIADRPALEPVLPVCSVLVGEAPMGTRDPATVSVPPGATVEFLPPFAGG